jgi:hypothetical protein
MPRPVHPPPVRGQGTDPPTPTAPALEPLPLENDGPPLEALPVETPDPLEPPRFETWAE